MSDAKRDGCVEIEQALVDYVDAVSSASERARVEEHCGACDDCAATLRALHELPEQLRSEPAPEPTSWTDQRQQIMASVGEIEQAEAQRTSGFDVRILMPIAAAILIALAGIVSLQSMGGGAAGTKPARAALAMAMDDPEIVAELSEVLGEPLVFSTAAWSEEQLPSIEDPAGDRAVGDSPSSLDDLDEQDLEDVREILGV